MRRLALVLALGLSAPAARAQWASDPAANLPLVTTAGEQVQPRVQPTPDGGAYVSWFSGDGYDVRLQRLDAAGVAQWGPDGVLVADRGYSSTVDYDLGIDAAGNALLAFRDDRATGDQITAALVAPDGSQPWGPTGTTLTATTAFVANPKITGTADGGSVVAWAEGPSTRLHALDASGAPRWGADVVLAPAAGAYAPSDLQAVGADVLLALVHQTGTFTSPKHLVAQRFDADGAPVWGAAPVAVFDGGSLQIGTFPTFVPDGDGGAVFAWYDVGGGALQCYAQRLRADGTEAFAHNGVALSTAPRERVAPDVAVDPVSGALYAFWTELGAQGAQGLSGQKLAADGTRLWSDAGLTVVAPGPGAVTQVRTVRLGDGALVAWDAEPAFGQDRLRGVIVRGDAPADTTEVALSTTPSRKSRLAAAITTSGMAVFVWQDARTDAADLYAQNVNPDGTLGTSTVGSAATPPAAGAAVRVAPNPTAGAVRIAAELPGVGAAEASVADALGRTVWRAAVPGLSGAGEVVWDGRAAGGGRAAAGVYVVRVQQGAWVHQARVVVVR